MPIAFLPNVPGARIVGSDLSLLARGFRTFRQPLEHAVDNVMVQHIIHQFEVGGEPPWAPHSESTIDRRSREGTLGGYPQDILVESGTLFESVTRRARWTITGQEAYFSNLPSRAAYGRFHMEGTQNMPERPWIQVGEQELNEIEDTFSKWVDGIVIANWVRRVRKALS